MVRGWAPGARRACLPLAPSARASQARVSPGGWLQRDLQVPRIAVLFFSSTHTQAAKKKSGEGRREGSRNSSRRASSLADFRVSQEMGWVGRKPLRGEGPRRAPPPRPRLPLWSPECGKVRNIRETWCPVSLCCEELCNRKPLMNLGLSLPICKMCTVISILQKCHEDYMRGLCQHDATAVG